MISLAISIPGGILLGAIIGALTGYWGFGIFIALLTSIALFFFLTRHFSRQLQTLFNVANNEIQKQNMERAIEILKSGYKLKNWLFLVKAQIDSQIGVILYTQKKFGEAYKFLQNSNPRIYMGYCMLAIGHMKNGKKDKAEEALSLVQKFNKKEAFVYSLSAYLYENEFKNSEKAIEALNKGMKHLPNNQNIKDHLLAIQNNKNFKMDKYGDTWYQMMLERNVVNKLQKKYMKSQQRKVNINKKAR